MGDWPRDAPGVHRSAQQITDQLHIKEATMTDHWDEFSKSLAQPLPRRESLRRLNFSQN